MTGDSGIAELDVVRSRLDLLDEIATEPRQKPQLGKALDVSRSTVDRAVGELESAGFVVREEEGYTITLYGDLFREQYGAFLSEARDLAAAGPLLETLPRSAPMSATFLRSATVHRASAPVPHRPVSEFEARLAEADRLRGLSRTISQPSTASLIRERVVDAGMEGELVVSSDLAAYMRAERFEPEREMASTGRYRLFAVESLPYGLALLDRGTETVAVLFVYGPSNDLLGTIENDDDDAVAWAEERYRERRSAAEEITERFRRD